MRRISPLSIIGQLLGDRYVDTNRLFVNFVIVFLKELFYFFIMGKLIT